VTVADAYSAGAAAWARGPMRVYGRLAELLVERSPIDLHDRAVLDLGAGTGAVSHAARHARVIAVDSAAGMLLADRAARPPAAVGDALALPFKEDAFDVVVAAFAFNHLDDPAAGMREAGRVGHHVLASTYAADDDHPVKRVVETALTEAGWVCPDWYRDAIGSMRSWGTAELAAEVVERAGLDPLRVEHVRVDYPELTALDLVRWRLGMAHAAEFAATHDVEARAVELLGDAGPLTRSALFIVARAR
jgi:SAM-dependent methyltransferase